MENRKNNILIPSATIVPEELQKLGKLPAIIYPVNQNIVFDYLLEQYKDKYDKMRIICHEQADKVHRRLEKYKKDDVEILDLPVLDDLGHTIYFGLEGINRPTIINFADTIVLDDALLDYDDAYYYTEDFISDTWTYFDQENGMITTIYDKNAMDSEEKAKLFVGVFKISDPQFFRKCLENAFENRSKEISTFYCALKMYSEQYPMSMLETDDWFDIGHADKYYDSKLAVKAREFNHITIDKNRGILKKVSDDKEKFIGEIKWYLKLPMDVEYVRPRIFSYSTSYNNPYVEMEYYSYHTVHELFLYGDLSRTQWRELFQRIQFVCHDFKRYSVSDDQIRPALEDMYLTKTKQRFEKMKQNDNFKNFFKNEISVNGKKYQSLESIMKLLEVEIPNMLYDVDEFHIIHGDLCFANIMIDTNLSFIKVIDPRGKFGKFDIYGDVRYELAKLLHSVDGKYDFIIKDMFHVAYNVDDATITYSIIDRKRNFDLYELFVEVFAEEIAGDIKKIEFIEALLFLSMIPLHGESLQHQMVMLGTGLEIINRVINIEKR